MKILGIETSCDETAAAVLTNDSKRIQILSNVVASSQQIHIKYGGIVPEQAAREQLKSIIPVIEEALSQAKCEPEDIDAIAVTVGPGLIGSLLVGVETAKTLSLVWKKPLIPVNHLIAHFYANWVEQGDRRLPTFPLIGLLISGGHTDLVLMTAHGQYKYLGGTRDDAAGECFDKCARLLDLPYPGGPNLSKLAASGNPDRFKLPRPMIDSDDLDFSFSGLKTAVLNLVNGREWTANSKDKSDLAAAVEEAISQVLVTKTIKAAQTYNIEQIILAGGVASNTRIAKSFSCAWKRTVSGVSGSGFYVPPPPLCTDNGVMVAACAFFLNVKADPLVVQANPNLHL